jgi:hypothetical protein
MEQLSREQFNNWIVEQRIYDSWNKKPILGVNVNVGWLPLVKTLIEELIEAGWNREVAQIKEKFGTLRFYIDDATDAQYEIIRKYENISGETCEVCGNPGVIRGGSWLKCLCDEHSEGKE